MQRLLLLFLVGILVCCACQITAADTQAGIIAKRMELGKNKPFTSIVPRSNEPTGYINVLRVWPESNEMRIAIAALQGIVNREKPQLYIGIDKPLRWLEYYGGMITIEPTERDIFKIFEKFKDSVKGIVVYDYSLDALANVAITYAGIEDLIPADPELAKTLSEKYGWKVVHDLRGKWKTRYEAYSWAYDNLFPKCTIYALSHYNHGLLNITDDPSGPNSETLRTGFMVDYAVAFRTFTWHVPTEPTKEEVALAEKIFESVPFHTPIFGRSSTQDCFPEPAFVSWVSEFGNLHIPAGMGNTSVLSGAKVAPEVLSQKSMPPLRDSGTDKIYIAFTISEKDNLEHVIGGGPPWHRGTMETDDPYRIWWADPWRGKVPIGWPIGPLVAEIAPTSLAHYTTTSTDNDCLMVALAGLSLSDPENYGASYPEIREKLLNEYCQMTGDFMKRLNWTMAQPVGGPACLRYFVKNIPTMQGIMEGYGTHNGMTPDKADYLLDGVPIFHSAIAVTVGTDRKRAIGAENERKARGLADQILTLPRNKPGFYHVWIMGWDFGPTTLKKAVDLLPPDFVVVRPDELAALYKKYKGSEMELTAASPKITPSGVVKDAINSRDGLIIDTGKAKFEIGWGKSTQAPPLKRIMGVDGKWRGVGQIIRHNPDNLTIKAFASKKIKDTASEKEYQLTYTYSNGEILVFNMQAIAGYPCLLITEESKSSGLPSWTFEPYIGFKPNTIYTDGEIKEMDYKDMRSMGSLPWYRWILAGKKEGPERDLIGVFTMAWAEWTNGSMIFWQRPQPTTFCEFYVGTGTKKFAIGSLDRNDPDAPKRIWNELNGK